MARLSALSTALPRPRPCPMVDENVSVEYDEKQRWIGMMWCVLCMQDRENNIISGNVGISLKGNTVELGEQGLSSGGR